MKTITNNLENLNPDYDLSKIADPGTILFLDIETTGFSARMSSLYLIGLAYLKDASWHITQFFAEKPEEEADILKAFLDFAKGYRILATFNGNKFDIPFISQKCEQHSLDFKISDYEGLDIYNRISPYKSLLGLSDCKQKTIEKFLRIGRDDTMSGGELIEVYLQYGEYGLETDLELLLLHNYDDMKGMLHIVSMLAYDDMLKSPVKVSKASTNNYTEKNSGNTAPGSVKSELLMTFPLATPIPRPVSFSVKGCYLSAEEGRATLRVPVYKGELKYFYAGYKDYYYLPYEDMAVHKSVAAYTDKGSRKQACASNCYTRLNSTFLPQLEDLFRSPFFKESYESKDLYFELTEEMKKDRDFFADYAQYVLRNMMI